MAKAVRADEVEAEPVEWLYRERIPKGELTVVAGQPDKGKGLFAAHIAAEVSRAGGKVLYSAIEDSHGRMTRPRLEAAGANLKNITLYRFTLPTMLDELMAKIKNDGIALVVMDPVASHLGRGLSRGSEKVREVITPLTELIQETGTALLAIDHVIKRPTKNMDALGVIAGSGSGIPAAARAAFLFGVDPHDEDARMFCVAKLNMREKPRAARYTIDTKEITLTNRKTRETWEQSFPYLVYDDEVDFDPMRMFDFKKNNETIGRPPDKRAAACEWLTLYLWEAYKQTGDGVLQKTLIEDAQQNGMYRKLVDRARDELKLIRKPEGGGPKTVLYLPQELIDKLAEADEEFDPDAINNDDPDADTITDEDLAKLLAAGPVGADDVDAGDDDAQEG